MEKGLSYSEMEDKGILSYEKESVEDGDPIISKFWHIGVKNTVVIMSATILKARQGHEMVKATLEAIPAILESLKLPAPTVGRLQIKLPKQLLNGHLMVGRNAFENS